VPAAEAVDVPCFGDFGEPRCPSAKAPSLAMHHSVVLVRATCISSRSR